MTHALVIDDDPVFRSMIERILVPKGFTVAAAADGRRGLCKARQRKPDIVITDILMPEMEGVETIFRLRQIDETMPILAISGGWSGSRPSLLKLVARLGATETLAKPFRAGQLLDAIEKCLSANPTARRH
jgi:CheY-like chemotaxis protein